MGTLKASLIPQLWFISRRCAEMLVTEDVGDRVMVFIDLANVQHTVRTKETSGFRLDYYRLVKELVGQRRLIGAYVFDAVSASDRNTSEPRRRLHDALRYLGFRVVAREVAFEEEGEQKEVDVALATEMLTGALRDAYDVSILVSGDRDFVPAVERIRSEGKRVEVAFFTSSTGNDNRSSFSHYLQKVADRVHDLDALPLLEVMGTPEVVPDV